MFTLIVTLVIIILTPIVFSRRLRIIIGSYLSRCHLHFYHGRRKTVENGDKSPCVTGIFVHPVKSLRAVSVPSCRLDPSGLENDRRLMLVKPRPPPNNGVFSPGQATHRFLTQRQAPSLAKINASLPSCNTNSSESSSSENNKSASSVCVLSCDSNKQTIDIDLSKEGIASYTQHYLAGVWDDTIEVADVGDEAAKFVQGIIRHDGEEDDVGDTFSDVRVVTMIPSAKPRQASEQYVPLAAMHAGQLPTVGLTDGFPILIASESSLAELNRRLISKGKSPIPMSRFRPNIVVTGTKPFEEDTWKAVKIGNAMFHIVKGCPRCKQSCTDQLTGERGEEPLKTLVEFRALGNNKEDVYFAQNAIAQDTAGKSIRVGDKVTVLTRGDPVWDIDAVQAE